MQPQGAALVNAAYLQSLTADINSINLCSDLQARVNEAMATLQAEVTAIEAQIATLLPLTTLPTDLGSVIKWITQFAAPIIRSYNNYLAQLAQTVADVSTLTAAIENAASRLTHCQVTVPPLVTVAGPG